MRTRYLITFLVILIVLIVPTKNACANAASRFTYETGLHLFIGNIILGLIEGFLIAKVFKTSKTRAVLSMIAANYFSAWIGFLGLRGFSVLFEVPLSRLVNIHNIQYFVWLVVLLAWVITIVLEWPFCLFALVKKKERVVQGLYASLLAQTVSYIVLVIVNPPFGHFYGSPHGQRRVEFAPVGTFARPNDTSIYFISVSGGDVYRIKADSSSKEKVATLNVMEKEARLVAKSDRNLGSWQLWIQTPTGDEVVPHLSLGRTVDTGITVSGFTQPEPEPDPNHPIIITRKPALDLRSTGQQDFHVSTGWLGVSWLEVEKRKEENKYSRPVARLQFDNHFLDWTTSNATVLPGNQIVYQLGSQIVLFDVDEYKLGLITLGRGPVVFMDQEPVVNQSK